MNSAELLEKLAEQAAQIAAMERRIAQLEANHPTGSQFIEPGHGR